MSRDSGKGRSKKGGRAKAASPQSASEIMVDTKLAARQADMSSDEVRAVVTSALAQLQALEAEQESLKTVIAGQHAISRERSAQLATAAEERDQARSELASFHAQLTAETSHRQDLETRIAEADARLRLAEHRIQESEAKAAEVDAARAALSERSAQLAAAAEERDQARSELASFHAQLTAETSHRQDLEIRISEAGARLRLAEHRIQESEAKAAEVEAALATERQLATELRKKVTELAAQLGEVDTLLIRTEARATAREQEIDAHVEARRALEARINAGQEELRLARIDLVSGADFAEVQKARIEGLTAALTGTEARLAAAETELDANAASVASLRHAQKEGAAHLELAKSDANLQRALVAKLQGSLASVQVDLFARTNELHDLQTRQSRALQKVAELDDDVLAALARVAVLEKAAAQTEKDRSRERVDYIQAHARDEQLTAQVEQLQDADRERVATIQSLSEERNRIEAEYEAARAASERDRAKTSEQRARADALQAEVASLRDRLSKETQSLENATQGIDAAQRNASAERARAQAADEETFKLRIALADAHRAAETYEIRLRVVSGSRLVRARERLVALRRHLRAIFWRQRVNPLFDAEYYIATYPDVAVQGVDPYAHFLKRGVDEKRNPNSLFDTAWYLQRYADVAKAGLNPLLHYYVHGVADQRDPHPLFSTQRYLEQHPELKESGENPLEHYLRTLRNAARP